MTTRHAEDRRLQLADQRRRVDFDTYDISVDEILRRLQLQRIDVAPVYQRQFRWDPIRQSRLIESVLLGIPIPPLFMATNTASDSRSTWEIVDGLQRLLSLANFVADDDTRLRLGLREGPLTLKGLDKLSTFNNAAFQDLPEDLKTTFQDRPLKVIVLNDKSEVRVRFDLFERLNTGGISLSDQEIRECIFRGPLIDLIEDLAAQPSFRHVVVLPLPRQKDGTAEEFVLRFFAFLECYREFEHSVKGFLDDFIEQASVDPRVDARRATFTHTFNFLDASFPGGLKTRKGQTPVNLFEAVAVGAALALESNPELHVPQSIDWLKTQELHHLITGGTNTRNRVIGRIEYCRDAFIHQNV